MATVSKYVPVEIVPTDRRVFNLRCKTNREVKEMDFTQLDFLQICTYIDGKNTRLLEKIKRFIRAVDSDNGETTDFTRKLPRRRVSGEQF